MPWWWQYFPVHSSHGFFALGSCDGVGASLVGTTSIWARPGMGFPLWISSAISANDSSGLHSESGWLPPLLWTASTFKTTPILLPKELSGCSSGPCKLDSGLRFKVCCLLDRCDCKPAPSACWDLADWWLLSSAGRAWESCGDVLFSGSAVCFWLHSI